MLEYVYLIAKALGKVIHRGHMLSSGGISNRSREDRKRSCFEISITPRPHISKAESARLKMKHKITSQQFKKGIFDGWPDRISPGTSKHTDLSVYQAVAAAAHGIQ